MTCLQVLDPYHEGSSTGEQLLILLLPRPARLLLCMPSCLLMLELSHRAGSPTHNILVLILAVVLW